MLLGGLFLVLGLAAFGLAASRRSGSRSGSRSLLGFGIFTALYGLRLLTDTDSLLAMAGASPAVLDTLTSCITYVLPLGETLAAESAFGPGLGSSLVWLRRLQVLYAAVAVPLDLAYGSETAMAPNNFLVLLAMAVFAVNGGVALARRLRAGGARGLGRDVWALLAGLAVLMLLAVNENLVDAGLVPWRWSQEALGMLALVAGLGYAIAHRFFVTERQLDSLNQEMETARRIQAAILPRKMPEVRGLALAARYRPMASVGGDFYDFLFLAAGPGQVGALVADVSGHGVPAALIASPPPASCWTVCWPASPPGASRSTTTSRRWRSICWRVDPILHRGELFEPADVGPAARMNRIGGNPRKGLSRRGFLALGAAALVSSACPAGPPQQRLAMKRSHTAPTPSRAPDGYLSTRPGRSARKKPDAPTGLQPLALRAGRRDGMLYVPPGYRADRPAPLVLLLHGAGGNAEHALGPFRGLSPNSGIEPILLAPESVQGSWDVIHGGFGPDVEFIDRALERVFASYAIDPARIAAAGFSDGASYALSLGLTNGDLFTHVIAFSPGFMAPGGQEGEPEIYVSHGTRDSVLPIDSCSRRLVPTLRRAGYDILYREFEGPHTVPPEIAREALEWFMR